MTRGVPSPAWRHSTLARHLGPLLRSGGLLLSLSGCGPPEPLEQRVERELLLRQRAALERALSSRSVEEADHATGAVVVIPAALLERLLSLSLPVEATVDRFHVTAGAARVEFGEGLALVRLEARVAWADRPDVSALVDVIGALEILGIRESTGSLTSRVEILGFETRDVQLGSLSPPVERLLDELVSRPAEELNRLLGEVDIPIRLLRSVRIPAVDEEEVTIAGVELPVRVGVHDVRVEAERLWVHLDVEVLPESGP